MFNFSHWWLMYLLWNCHQMNVTGPSDDKSTLVQVMVWCRQAITWANVEPDPCRHMASLGHNELTHLPLVLSICISELGQALVQIKACRLFGTKPLLNQYWVIANWTFRNKLQWNSHQNTKLFIHENAFENIVNKRVAILSRGRWVN